MDFLWLLNSEIGLGEPYPVSAIHGSGTGDLLDIVIDKLPEENDVRVEKEKIMMSILVDQMLASLVY